MEAIERGCGRKKGSELPEQSAPQAVYIAMFLNV
jgi:hypothetical protein